MLSDQEKAKWDNLPDEKIKSVIDWMTAASISTYRNDEGTAFDAEFHAFWAHYRYVKIIATSRGIVEHMRPQERGTVYYDQSFRDFLAKTLPTEVFRPGAILLDKPLPEYEDVCRVADSVQFLCGASEGAHLITLLREYGIKYEFMGYPEHEWAQWKSSPNYRGK